MKEYFIRKSVAPSPIGAPHSAEVFVLLSGTAELGIFDSLKRLKPGDMIILPYAIPSRFYGQNCEAIHCFCDNDLMKRINQVPMVSTDFYYWTKNAGSYHPNLIHCTAEEQAEFSALIADYQEADEYIRFSLLIRFLTICCTVLQREALLDLSHASSALTLQVIDYLEHHLLDEKNAVDTIADAHYVSSSHLQRIFRQDISLSLNNYLRRRRLEEAKKWLTYGYDLDFSLRQSGFLDKSNFAEQFKSHFGISLKEFMQKEQSL